MDVQGVQVVRNVRTFPAVQFRCCPEVIISSRLDKKTVPEIFVKFIVYHEMLHADEKEEEGARKRGRVHSRAFRAKEKLFKDYSLIKKIQSSIIERL